MKRSAIKATAIQQILQASRERKQVPVLSSLLRNDVDSAALMTKMERDGRRPLQFDHEGNILIDIPNQFTFQDKASNIVDRIVANRNLRKMLTDIELISQILVSSVLAPKDFITKELHLDIDDSIYNSRLYGVVKQKFSDFFETTYKIKDRLYVYLDDVLINTGSKPVMVLPENSIDDIMNGNIALSNESLKKLGAQFKPKGAMAPMGILGPGLVQKGVADWGTDYSLAAESLRRKAATTPSHDETVYIQSAISTEDGLFVDSGIRITDNHNILRLSDYEEAMSTHRNRQAIEKTTGRKMRMGLGAAGEAGAELSNVIREGFSEDQLREAGFAVESMRTADGRFEMSDQEMVNLVYMARQRHGQSVKVLKTQSQLRRRSLTEPLIQELPSEAVHPVFVPGNVERHVAYLVLLDDGGNPLTEASMSRLTGDMVSNNRNSSFVRSLISKTAVGMNGFSCNNQAHMAAMVNVFANTMEADLMARWRNGDNNRSIRVGNNQELYAIMIARKLQGSNTRMLWVPKEFMTYFAIDYDDVGVGVSLLTRNETVGAMRAGLLFADLAGAIRNSIGTTVYDITLDEDDENAEKRIEQMKGLAYASRQSLVPTSAGSPIDMSQMLNRAGVSFRFQGNSRIPQMNIERTTTQADTVRPDTELLEYMQKVWTMGFSIPPEMIESAKQPELAMVAFNQSLMLTKRVVQIQELINPQVTNLGRTVTRHHEGFISEICNIVSENFDDVRLPDELRKLAMENPRVRQDIIEMTVRDTVDSLILELAKPEMATNESKMTELEAFETALTKRLDVEFGDEKFTAEVFGELGDKAPLVRQIVHNSIMRKFMDQVGLGTEVTELFSTENDEIRLNDLIEEHTKGAKGVILAVGKLFSDNVKFKRESDAAVQALGADGNSDYGGSADSSSSSDTSSDSGGGPDSFDDFAMPGEDGGEAPGSDSKEGDDDEPGGDPLADLGGDAPMSF